MDRENIISIIEKSINTGVGRAQLAEQPEVVKFLNEIALAHALDWGEKVDCWEFWKVIFKREDITFNAALRYTVRYHSTSVWQIVLSRPDILKFLQEGSLERVIFYAELVNYWEVWNIVLYRPDISIEKVLALAEAFFNSVNNYNHAEVLETVKTRNDYKPVE